jgi:hypothetical protein
VLGSHTAENNRSITLTIESSGINQKRSEAGLIYGATKEGSGASSQLVVDYNDTRDATDELRIIIYEHRNRSNEIENSTVPGPLGELTFTKPLTAQQANNSWVVELRADRGNETTTVVLPIGGQGSLLPSIPWPYPQIGGMALILLTPALLGGQRAETGAVVAALLGALLWWADVLPEAVNIATVAFALIVAITFKLRSRQGAVQ